VCAFASKPQILSRPSTAERLAIVVLLLAVVVVYANSLTGVFVFDDTPGIVENPTLRHAGQIGGLIAPPGDEAGTVGGRPVLNLSLAFNYVLGGTQVAGYHAFNLAVHLAATLLLFGILRRTLKERKEGVAVAFAAALLWAVHPLQTEAVTYVIQRAESLMGLFYLLTLYGFIRFASSVEKASEQRGAGPRVWGVLSVLACFLGMGTKEVMVSAPLMVLLYDRTFVAGSFRDAWHRRRAYYLGLGASWLLLAVLVASTHGRGGSAGFSSSAGIWPYALTECRALAVYLRLAFWPHPLVFDYGTALVRDPGAVVGQFLLLLILFVATVWALCRRWAPGFLGGCFFAILAPTSSIVPIATEPMAEHRMYLPLAAVVVLAVVALYTGLRRVIPNRATVMLYGTAGLAAVALGVATIRRNEVYHSETGLWSDTVEKAPANPRADNNLGVLLLNQGQTAKATAEFYAAVAADPGYAPAQYDLGATLLDANEPAEAIPHLEKALSAPRHQAELQLFLGEALGRVGRLGEAAEHDREALRLAPESSDAAFELGNTLAALGRYDKSIEALRRAARLAPDRPRIRNNLGNALMLAGRLDAAVAEYRAALRLRPDDQAIRDNLNLALRSQHP
jgi:tetratricopeptide (TPR) repeat protein